MALPRHNPPGFVNDLTDENKILWSNLVSSFMNTRNVSPRTTPQFYDATRNPEQDVQTAPVTWIGFPKQVKLRFPNDEDRWREADSRRDVQDEYLEWSIKRNNDGKITKIVYCNEPPEYFELLARTQRQTLIDLYKELHPDVNIQATDLFRADGSYNPTNKWNSSTNTGTIMHLIQSANTLGAEIDLGGRATVVRKRQNGTVITDAQELIRCSKYGSANRNSDPAIGIACNSQVRGERRKLTINDPAGLYIDSVNWGVVKPPSSHPQDRPRDFWKWTRGSAGNHGRAEFEVPPEKGYVVGDLLVNGHPLKYGSQLADYISIRITARTSNLEANTEPRFCGDPPPPALSRGQAAAAPADAATTLLQEIPGLASYASVRE